MKHTCIVVLCLLATSCSEGAEVPPAPYVFTITATSDAQPLENVAVVCNDSVLGTTSAEGLLTVQRQGTEGQPVSFSVSCPEGYRTPDGSQNVTLRRVLSLDPQVQARGVELTFACAPEFRDAVVIVRTHEQAGLPVFVDGVEVTRTDASGAAHIYRRMTPNARFQVRVATVSNPRLRPVDPSQSYTVPDHDTVFLFDRQFEEEAAPRRRRRRRRRVERPRLPVRIGGGR